MVGIHFIHQIPKEKNPILSLGKNIGIAQPRSQPPRPHQIKATKARYLYPNSVMNSKSNTGEYGTPSGGNRKLNVYNI